MGPFHIASTAIVLLIAVGVALRRNRRLHPRIMITALVADLILVLWIEFSLHAVEQVAGVSETDSPRGLLLFHAAVSTGVLVCYAALVILGRRLLRGDETVRRLHRRWAVVFLVLRASNFITSFLV